MARLRAKLGRGATVVMWQWTDALELEGQRFDASALFVPLDTLKIKESL